MRSDQIEILALQDPRDNKNYMYVYAKIIDVEFQTQFYFVETKLIDADTSLKQQIEKSES